MEVDLLMDLVIVLLIIDNMEVEKGQQEWTAEDNLSAAKKLK